MSENTDYTKVRTYLDQQIDSAKAVQSAFFEASSETLMQTALRIAECLKSGGKLLICGNGGSASDAQHFAGEMIGRFLKERKALAAIALNTDTSVMTAVGNDYGYDQVFQRQVDGLGKPEDLLVAISTSGNSPNVLQAVAAAKKIGMGTIALTGKDGGKLGGQVDLHLNVAKGTTSPRIQETHIMIIHLLVDLVDEFYLTS